MSDGRTWGTIIGGVVGYFTGGIGFAAGAAIGGTVGALLEPKKHTETNRIDDVKVSISRYGDGIPETWGNNIPTATWIWSTYIIQMPEEQSEGKGGGVENTNYRQFIHGLLCLGRTPPAGSTVTIRKAWVDGKLTYDGSTGLSPAQALATTENPFASILLFDGQDGQLPIPIIEAYEGIGNVPAFTGRLSLFVFGLECPGGRIPQLSFEICVNAVGTSEVLEGETFSVDSAPWSSSRAPTTGDPVIAFMERATTVDGYDVDNKLIDVYAIGLDGLTKLSQIIPPDTAYNFNALNGSADIDAICYRAVTASDFIDQEGNDVVLQDGTRKRFAVESLAFGQSTSCWSKKGNRFAIAGDANQSSDMMELFYWDSTVRIGVVSGIQAEGLFVSDACVWVTYTDTGTPKIQARSLVDFSLLASANLPLGLEVGSPSYYCADGSDLISYTANLSLLSLWRITLVGATIVFDTEIQAALSAPSITDKHAISVAEQMVVGVGGDTTKTMFVVRFEALTPVEAPIVDLIESQCERAGLLVGQIDVSTIDDSVWGYTFNKSPASARANIAPLMTYSALGVVEEDNLLRFFHRQDKSFVATIDYDELGFAEDGSEPGDPFPVLHMNAQELPRSLTLTYNDPNFDYQVSTVKAMMLSVDSGADLNETLDVATDGGRAATIARRLLLERWVAQNTRSLAVSRAFAYLSAGDVIRVEYPRGILSDWMTSKITDTGARIEIECFPSDSDLIIQTVPGPGGFQRQQIQPLAPLTLLTIVNSAILRDADSNAGVYAAMAGYSVGWPGAELFAGDDATSLQSRGTVTFEAVQGTCETVLANYTLGNVDETNLLTVDVGHGSLISIARDVLLDGTQNVAAVGSHGRWEIVKFQRADDLGGGIFLLSGLLRGLQGTEWAMSLHQADDRFVLLSDGGVLRPNFEAGSIGQTKVYKAITTGRSFNSASTQESVNTGEGLKPLSPTTLRKSFSGSNLLLTWGRRSRLANQWWLGVVPLGEESERYEIDVFSDSTFTTLKRTLTATSASVTYTSADQITDFGVNQTSVNVRIYQMSGAMGRGHELQQTI